MLLRLLLIFSFSSLLFAKTRYQVKKIDDSFLLVSEGKKFKLKYNQKPKIESVKEKDGITIVEYFSGEFGTSNVFKISNRMIINNKNKQIIIDAPYKYEKLKNPKWIIDTKNKKINVYDPNSIDQKKSYQ